MKYFVCQPECCVVFHETFCGIFSWIFHTFHTFHVLAIGFNNSTIFHNIVHFISQHHWQFADHRVMMPVPARAVARRGLPAVGAASGCDSLGHFLQRDRLSVSRASFKLPGIEVSDPRSGRVSGALSL